MTTSVDQRIAEELGVRERQVTAAVELLDGGATVPFIARYRKEVTGMLDDAQLRTLEERLRYLRELEERRAAILESIRSQGKLDEALEAQIMAADSKARLEDIYLPYKPKRRTRAQIAREAGLEPLAEQLLADPGLDPRTAATAFVDAERGVADPTAALDGARAILVERFAEDADLIGSLREQMWSRGRLVARVRDGQQDAGAKFSDYFDFSEPYTRLPSHRVLAMFRGEKEGVLDLTMESEEAPEAESGPVGPTRYELEIGTRFGITDRGRPADRWLTETVRWAWRTRILIHLGADLRMRLWQAAEDESVRVFATNLRDLLLAAPAGSRTTMGLDPGLRTGVKVAVVDATGKVLATETIYPHEPRRQWDDSIDTLARLARAHSVELIAIGNGTASRETDKLAGDLIKLHPGLDLTKVMVSEAGASVYSASAYASQELPGMDVSLRGAVSIARRLQDPLAELVKIEPRSIGVGQYQHDLSEIKLSRSLDAVVEDCVNGVGVDVNTASAPLLTRVSGIGAGLAENIVLHRDTHGPFRTRRALKEVPRLGPKAFEQCAGFLRIPGGDDPLDASAVHPESYPVVRRILASTGTDLRFADRQERAAAGPQADGLRRRDLRPADRHRHHRRAGEAGARPTAGVPDRDLRRGRREDRRPDAGHAAGGCGHQRRRVRRVRRRRRTPGRSGARVGDVEHLRQGPAGRGQVRRRGPGQGARRGRTAQADLAHAATGGRGRLGHAPYRRWRWRAPRPPGGRSPGPGRSRPGCPARRRWRWPAPTGTRVDQCPRPRWGDGRRAAPRRTRQGHRRAAPAADPHTPRRDERSSRRGGARPSGHAGAGRRLGPADRECHPDAAPGRPPPLLVAAGPVG